MSEINKESKTTETPNDEGVDLQRVVMPVACVMCGIEIDQSVWPKYMFDPQLEQPLCFDCWEIEYERAREDNEYDEEA
jgi:hypothetical protein